MSLEIPVSARFLTTVVAVFIATVVLLGGAGYVVTRVAVPPARDMFRNAAFEFELAPGWSCELEETEFVCRPGKPPHPAIVIMAMKERNDKDTLAAYEEHLRQPKRAVGDKGEDGKLSEVRFVKRRTLGSREWVESLHAGSEIANYDTYYLATTTSYIGILVTMSVHRNQSDRYIAQLNDMMGSLSVYQR
jgi:hypothetical protein